jgi:MYXO-CTERM domain-containing protein
VADVPAETLVPATAPVVETTRTATTGSPWMWIVGGIVVLLAIAGLLLGRRRRPVDDNDAIAYAPTIIAPVAAPAPMPMAEAMPVIEEASAPAVAASDARPWIRMTLEPTATETHGDASIMTYQLIVENEGPVDARDVQVSSFLLRDASSSPMEDALIRATPLRGRIDVPSGGSVRVEASVVVSDEKEAKIVADARYPLPDGGEGHLAARFAVDTGTDELATRVDRILERA